MFIDTNVLVYSRIIEAPFHDVAGESLERVRLSNEPLRISRQIIREYVSVVTRPQTWLNPLRSEEVLEEIDWLVSLFDILEDGPAVTEWLITLLREVSVGGRQIHDANIIATMLAHGERKLLTFNTSDFRRYGDRIELMER